QTKELSPVLHTLALPPNLDAIYASWRSRLWHSRTAYKPKNYPQSYIRWRCRRIWTLFTLLGVVAYGIP
ncbi:hypothetical protein V5H47_25530, partial [Salmonella enterica]|uniref:hypothetical protein n=1 Tax=Salmonella enterica TaxID=28901 RepID=UPI002FCDB3DB